MTDMTEQWLDEHFSELWREQDVFAQGKALSGQVYRELEQRQTLAFESAGKRYFIKRHGAVPLAEIFKNLFSLRLPVVSARNEYRAIRAMQQAGNQVPVIAAYGKRGLLPSTYESFLVTHDVGPHITLEDYCRDWRKTPPAFSEKRQLILQIAGIARRMHAAGICHRDFYLCHFLKPLAPADKQSLVVIDLHRALVKQNLSQRWIIKDLGALFFSAMDIGLTEHDLLRFISAYRQQKLSVVIAQEAVFWRKVRARAEALYKRH